MLRSWWLDDVVAAAEAHPQSFFIPPAEERMSIAAGQLVRLHFVLAEPTASQPRAERMWVEVSERSTSGATVRYGGILTNKPAYIHGLNAGDAIEFGPEHIARTQVGSEHPDFIDAGEKAAFVSAAVFAP